MPYRSLPTESDVLVSQSFFRLFAIFDVSSRCIPAKHPRLFIEDRVVSQKPMILPVFTACALFVFKRLSTR
jgi:hypothetical protein